MLALGGYVLAVHYESLIVPATILYGEVQYGKSEGTKAALSTTGSVDGNFFNKADAIS